jgi:hypothetical protein
MVGCAVVICKETKQPFECTGSLHNVRRAVMPRKGEKNQRELIDTGRDKRFVRRNEKGQFEDVVDVGRSLAQDRKQQAKRKVPAGQGDRGDQKRK